MLLSNSWEGNLELKYYHSDGITHCNPKVKAPLKIQRPFYPENKGICHSILLHTAGGVVGGDRLWYDIHLQPMAKGLLTTAAAGKIYRSGGAQAQQIVNIRVEKGAGIEWLPQENILFEGALYQQQLRVDLATDAYCLAWDITRFGRTARGEKFLKGEWYSATEIWQEGIPLWIDRQFFPGSEALWYSPNGLADNCVAATLLWVGIPITSSILQQIHTLWQSKPREGEAGYTILQGQGLLCRYRGKSTSEARSWFTQVWHLIRVSLLHLPAIKPRVW